MIDDDAGMRDAVISMLRLHGVRNDFPGEEILACEALGARPSDLRNP